MKTLSDNERLTNTERELKTSILASFAQIRRDIQLAYQDKSNSIKIANAHIRASLTSNTRASAHHEKIADDIFLNQFEYDELLAAYHAAVNKAMFDVGLPPHIMENGIYPGYK